MSRMSSSWAVMKASATVLWLDKELLVFPLLSGGAVVMITATFVAPIVFFGGPEALGALDDPRYVMYSGGFLYYLVLYTAVFFFNTGLVGAALIRLDGGDPTIMGYAAIAATLGIALRAIEERVGVLGRIVVGLIGGSWTLATYMTVPVLVTRDVGPIDAVKESASVFKRTWGEQVVGNAGIGLASFMLFALMTATAVPLIICHHGQRGRAF